MPEPVTVMIPVGPFPQYKRWLAECVASATHQTYQPTELLLVDDMAGVAVEDLGGEVDEIYWGEGRAKAALLKGGRPIGHLWRAPWRLGDVCAINCGVALAESELIFRLACDDTIEPDCVELCVAEWEASGRRDGYYYVGCHYMGGEFPDQDVPFFGAMVTKGLWRMTGGGQPEAVVGAGDCAFISILMTYFPGTLVKVAGGKLLYNYRVHDGTVTARSGPWQGVILETRGLLIRLWEPPNWGRLG